MDEKPKSRSLYNPSLSDIGVDFDKLGSNPEHYILKAGNIQEFPSHIADLIEEELANKLLWANLPANRNRDKRFKELLKIIRV